MREFSKVGCGVWHSRKFRGMKKDDDARYLYLYLLTNPHINSAGCYDLSEGYVTADMEWDVPRYQKALDRLSKARLIEANTDLGTILIANWVRFNEPTNAKHAVGLLRELQDASDERLKWLRFQEFLQPIADRKLLNDKAGGDILGRLCKEFREPIETKESEKETQTEKESERRVEERETETRSPLGACAPEGAAQAGSVDLEIPAALDRRFATPFLTKGRAA
jgi:hypothetical protein